jgi:tRNA(fMet)-specific endonuclease VapC
VKLNAFLQPLVSWPFNDAAAELYADIRYQLEVQGTPISIPDLQIAAITLVNNLTLVTHNTKEFTRVPGLNFVDWES